MSCFGLSLLLLLLSSCAAPERFPRPPLTDQVLRPRAGHLGLTNRACEAWDEKGACSLWVIKDYDLHDAAVRKTLFGLGFICKISGKRYQIVEQEPGLRSQWWEWCGFLRTSRCRKEETAPVEAQFLLDAAARCFDPDRYDFDEVN